MPESTLSLNEPLKILVVDDDSAVRAHMAYLVDQLGHQVIEANSADWALELFQKHQPDLVFTDIEMPEHNGYWLAAQIRGLGDSRWVPIIYMSALSVVSNVKEGIRVGGDDYLAKPVHPVVFEAKILAMRRLYRMHCDLQAMQAQLRLANESLKGQSERDVLTGLLNRRGMEERLEIAIRHAQRQQSPLTVMLCDVDFFKKFNDAAGHQAGDECLKVVGRLLRDAARRPHDAAARYGGEEFVLILPDTPAAGAMTLSRTITRLFATTNYPHPASSVAPHVTISGGVYTCVPDETTTGEHILKCADDALYQAKHAGRARFMQWQPAAPNDANDASVQLAAGAVA